MKKEKKVNQPRNAPRRKLWKLPEEIRNLFSESSAMTLLRDRYIEKVFGYRKAAKAAKEARVLVDKAWMLARELHPDMPSSLTYLPERGGIVASAPNTKEARE